MLAGTESPGRLYRFDADDRPFVLLDSGLTELRAVSRRRRRRRLRRGRRARRRAGRAAKRHQSPSRWRSPRPPTGGDATGSASSRATVAAIRRLSHRPSGTWESIWETADAIYDLAATDDGGVLVATGPKAGSTRSSARATCCCSPASTRSRSRDSRRGRRARRARRVRHGQPRPRRRVGTGVQSPADLRLRVRDTKSVATWGLIRWEGAGARHAVHALRQHRKARRLLERLGRAATRAARASRSRARRRASCSGAPCLRRRRRRAAPQLTSVTVAYLPRNTRPVVTRSPCIRPGVVFQRPFSSDDGAIAGLDDADRRRAAAARRHRAAAARAGPPHVSEGPADARLEGRGRRQRSADLRAAVPPRRRDRPGASCARA